MASMHLWRNSPAWTVKIAVHMRATKARMQMAGREPYMPKMLRTMTGKGMLYVAPILPVKVTTTLQMRKPKKTMGMVSRAVKPKDMTLETVAASGGASWRSRSIRWSAIVCCYGSARRPLLTMSEAQYAQ
jgi:hypothetical protein